jgi:hypothetical protein
MNLLQGGSLAVVFVVAADLELEPIALVAAFRRPVEDRVVAHQELDPAAPGRIGLVAGWVLGPANIVRCRAHAAIGGALRHLRPLATYLAGFWPCEYVAASDGGLDSGALGEPGQLRSAVTGLHEKPFHVLFHRAD